MGQGFIPEGDKLHQLQPQRPGVFIAITEQGRFFEVMALMNDENVMAREWGIVEWDDEKAKTEIARVNAMLAEGAAKQQQMQSHGGQPPVPSGPQAGQRRSPIITPPGTVVRPGTM